VAGRKINIWLKLALEFGPLVAFLIAFSRLKSHSFSIGGTEYSGFVIATALFVPLLVATTLILWRLSGRLSAMQIVTLVIVVVFGGLTVWLNDPRFLKMKPTLLYLLFAGALGYGLLRGRSYLELVMDEAVPLQPEGWMRLTRRIMIFFLALAGANEVIRHYLSDQAWVYFKFPGTPILMFLFFMAQSGLLKAYSLDDES